MLRGRPLLAVYLASASATAASNLTTLEILAGGTIDMGGLSAAVDVMLSSDDVLDIKSGDLGLDYAMSDMALAFTPPTS